MKANPACIYSGRHFQKSGNHTMKRVSSELQKAGQVITDDHIPSICHSKMLISVLLQRSVKRKRDLSVTLKAICCLPCIVITSSERSISRSEKGKK